MTEDTEFDIPNDTPEEIRETIRGLLEQEMAEQLMGEDGQSVVAKIEAIDAQVAELLGVSNESREPFSAQ